MKIVVIHGTFTDVFQEDWFVSCKNEFESHQIPVVLEQFPCDDYDELTALGETAARAKTERKQTLTNWLNAFETVVLPQIKDEDKVFFVAHSLGPLFSLHAITKYHINVAGAVFVSPCLTKLPGVAWQFDLENSTFYKDDFDQTVIRKLIPRSYTVYSKNDPYIPIDYALAFANLLGSTTIAVKNGDHLGGKFTKLPLVEELMKTLIDYRGLTNTN